MRTQMPLLRHRERNLRAHDSGADEAGPSIANHLAAISHTFRSIMMAARWRLKKITAAFDGGRMTSDGGVMVLAQAERRLAIAEKLAAVIADPRDPLRLVHSKCEILPLGEGGNGPTCGI